MSDESREERRARWPKGDHKCPNTNVESLLFLKECLLRDETTPDAISRADEESVNDSTSHHSSEGLTPGRILRWMQAL